MNNDTEIKPGQRWRPRDRRRRTAVVEVCEVTTWPQPDGSDQRLVEIRRRLLSRFMVGGRPRPMKYHISDRPISIETLLTRYELIGGR